MASDRSKYPADKRPKAKKPINKKRLELVRQFMQKRKP